MFSAASLLCIASIIVSTFAAEYVASTSLTQVGGNQTATFSVCTPTAAVGDQTPQPCPITAPSNTSSEDLPISSNQSLNLSYSLINHHFDLFEELFEVSLTCVNCTTNGTALLIESTSTNVNDTNASFWDDITDGVDETLDFLKYGVVSFHIQDFSAHIELGSEVAFSKSYTVPLISEVPIEGFKITKDWDAGLFVQMFLMFGIELDTGIDLTYGFDVALNPDAYINITMNHLEHMNTSAYGFEPSQGLTITPIPLNINDSSISLTVTAQLRTQISLRIDLSDEDHVALDAWIDTPQLNMTASTVSNVTQDCNPASPQNSSIAAILGEALLVVPAVVVDVGVDAQATIDGHNRTVATTIAATTSAVDMWCYKFDTNVDRLVPASAYVASVTSAAAASASASASADASVSAAAAAAAHSRAAGEIGKNANNAGRADSYGHSFMALAIFFGLGCVLL